MLLKGFFSVPFLGAESAGLLKIARKADNGLSGKEITEKACRPSGKDLEFINAYSKE